MSDKKISELTNITGANLADADEFVVVDSSASETKAITWAELKEGLDTGTGFVRITGDTMTGNLSFGDNDKAIFGAGSDLQIYHDGSHSYIDDAGTGDLRIRADNLLLKSASGEDYITATANGSVSIAYDNATKLSTTSTGVDVTGQLQADSGQFDGNVNIDGTITSDGLTVDGAVAINGTSAGQLTIDATGQYGQILFEQNSGNNSGGDIIYDHTSDQLWLRSLAVGGINLKTSSTAGSAIDRLTVSYNGDISFYEDTGTTPKFFWDASAEALGIGTSSPSSPLTINRSTDGDCIEFETAGTIVGKISTDAGRALVFDADPVPGGATATTMRFNVDATERMRIDASGMLNAYYGISVDGGTIKLDGNYPVGTNNVALGDGALDAVDSGAIANIAIGHGAATTLISGDENTAVGNASLATATTAINNTAVGSLALQDTTTGSYNVAVGKDALQSNTTASNNTAVGYQAGYDNTTGANSVFIGHQAGENVTTGNAHVLIGQGTGSSITTNSYNTFVGQGVGTSTTGGYNTFVGVSNGVTGACGHLVTSGTKNTIIGGYSGNQGGLDIRTSSNNIVLSDGDGNPRMFSDPNGRFNINRSGTYNARLALDETAAANIACDIFASDTGYYTQVLQVRCARGGTTGYNLIQARNSTNTECFKVDGYGDVKNTNNSYGALSDEKLKENIVDSGSQWDDIKALRVRKYSMKADSLDAPNKLGVIAQELEAAGMSGLVSETIDRDEDGNDLGTVTKAVVYSILYMKAVKALQEAMERIEQLEADVAALKNP